MGSCYLRGNSHRREQFQKAKETWQNTASEILCA